MDEHLEAIHLRLINMEARQIAYLARLRVLEDLVVDACSGQSLPKLSRTTHEKNVEFVQKQMVGFLADQFPDYASEIYRILDEIKKSGV